MKPFGLVALAVAVPLVLGEQACAQGDEIFVEPERPPPPTDMSIPVPAAPKAVKAPAPPRNLPPPKQPVVGASLPPPDLLEMMVRSVLVAVNQANFTDNYSVLHALGTRELQTRMKPADLSKSFALLRKKGVDLTTVLSYPVQFSKPPAIGKDGALELRGTVPAKPQQIDFAIAYFPVAGYWRIDALTLSVTDKEAESAAGPATSSLASSPVSDSGN